MSNKTNYNYKKEEWKIIECKLGLRLGLNSNFLKFQSFTIQLTVSSKNLLDTTIFFYLLLRVYWIAILTEAKMLNFLLIKKKNEVNTMMKNILCNVRWKLTWYQQ